MLLAVMDLGSNSFKMTVAQWAPEVSKRQPFIVLHKERHPIQLGASVFKDGRISVKDFKSALKAMEKMQARLGDFSSPILKIVATSAIRDSSNGKDFVRAVRSTLGLPIEVITGLEEAGLIAEGLTLEFPRVKRGLLIDIGGGSTEVAAFGSDSSWHEKFCFSFKMGSVRLATQFFSKKNKAPKDLMKIRKSVASLFNGRIPPGKVEKLIGSAGTIQSLGDILAPHLRDKVIRKSLLDKWIQTHIDSSAETLKRKFKLQQSRARVIVPGAIILSEVMKWLGQNELRVTRMSLRDGVMVDLVQQWKSDTDATLDHKGLKLSNRIIDRNHTERILHQSLQKIVAHFHGNLSHSTHTARLCLSIYDQMMLPRTSSAFEERRLLLAAAYLHDIGKVISESSHHKHSEYIIRNLKISNFTDLDLKKIALVALFHRKEAPPKKDPLPLDLRGVHADQVRRLCAILRLVDGLDKESSHNTESIKIRFSKKQALVELTQWAPEFLNLEYFRNKASYFEEYFECKLVPFVHPKRLTKIAKIKARQ